MLLSLHVGDVILRIVEEEGPTSTGELARRLSLDEAALYDDLMRCGRSMRLKVRDGTWMVDPGPLECVPPDM